MCTNIIVLIFSYYNKISKTFVNLTHILSSDTMFQCSSVYFLFKCLYSKKSVVILVSKFLDMVPREKKCHLGDYFETIKNCHDNHYESLKNYVILIKLHHFTIQWLWTQGFYLSHASFAVMILLAMSDNDNHIQYWQLLVDHFPKSIYGQQLFSSNHLNCLLTKVKMFFL